MTRLPLPLPHAPAAHRGRAATGLRRRMLALGAAVLAAVSARADAAQDVSGLRLVPFPKQVSRQPGEFALGGKLVFEVPADAAGVLGRRVAEEFGHAGLAAPEVRGIDPGATWWRLSASPAAAPPPLAMRDGATPEDYALDVRPDAIVGGAAGRPGLLHGIQTLRQLVRANRAASALPCLTIRDWPSLRWRCLQDDITRGPSSRLETLQREAALGAELRMNLFTYYMEYQYAFRKHPVIGPKDGSLTPEDLTALVAFAKPLGVDILGNQQSFGHFERILAHKEYAPLGEAGYVLCPVKEESYRLLDDLYSEVIPLLPFPFFNVCCDETGGLGEGASKDLAKEIGVGGVYVRHIVRLHDLLKDKYGKRMMMWGDIILTHPDRLKDIPKDTLMMTWGYDAAENFEGQITPFAKSGYEFFVCPGISNWSRILPDFGVATTNIRHFVRDGAKHGALGMLNTAWEDDGEALHSPNWHGHAWGAECAWNASATAPADFNRRLGAVLFGEKGDHFGRAIDLLARAHRLPGMQGMNNGRFWQDDLVPQAGPTSVRRSAEALLAVVRPAIEHLVACKQDATVNADLLDGFLLGARRMELIGRRMLDALEAAQAYRQACDAPPAQAAPLLARAEQLIRQDRDAHEALGNEFRRIWLLESKPYALDWTMGRYQSTVGRYEALARRLADARAKAEAGQPLPRPEELGLALAEGFARRTRPHKVLAAPLAPDAPWAEPAATHRLGLTVEAGSADRADLPVEVDVRLPEALASRPVRAFRAVGSGTPQEIPAQVEAAEEAGAARLVCVVPGAIPKGGSAAIHVYLGLPGQPGPAPGAVSTRDATNGAKWIENDKVRLLLGKEGGHVYRWEVKALGHRDLTMPGEDGWAGFSDMAFHYRQSPHALACTARGPALVRYRCTEAASGMVKTISLFAGASWMEVVLDEPAGHYWDFDDPKNFAADGPSPGTYLFSDGRTGPVGKEANGVSAQVETAGVFWGIKFNKDRLALGLATPEVAAVHHVAPGAGAGGVGIEASPPAGHFVTFAGLLADEPAAVINRLRQTLDFRNPPGVVVHGLQAK